jgi:hypothetical protein
MGKENVGYIHNRVLFKHKEEQNHVMCTKIYRTADHHVKENTPDSERKV